MNPDGLRRASKLLSGKYWSLINHSQPYDPCNANYTQAAEV